MSSNGYPFTSRRQILGRIAAEPPFAHECVSIIEERKGWMASHRARASKLVARMAAGAPTAADYAEALELAARYGKTLARVFRERKLAARPELGTQAAVFGVVGPPTQAATPTETVASSPEPVSEDTADVPIAPGPLPSSRVSPVLALRGLARAQPPSRLRDSRFPAISPRISPGRP